MKKESFRWSGCLLLTFILFFSSLNMVSAQDQGRILAPIGGGYSDIYPGLVRSIIPRAVQGKIKILILPTAYSSNPELITEAERATNLKDAEIRRGEIEGACQRAAPAGTTCRAEIIPVFTKADAQDKKNAAQLDENVTAVFMLGGDQTVAMLALANTAVEDALDRSYRRGAVISGTSAGGGMQSLPMLAGYRTNFAAETSLNFGAADVWADQDRRGLKFGVDKAILDQHFMQRSRLTRLLNAIVRPDSPPLGIGVDAYTGAFIYDEHKLGDVFGLYTVTILDASTFHAAEGVRYVGSSNALSLRNVLVHLIASGGSSYDLNTKQHSLGPAQPKIKRNFDGIKIPSGAGQLILGGDFSASLENNLKLFADACRDGPAAVIASGYPTDRSAETVAGEYLKALKLPGQVVVVRKVQKDPVALPEGAVCLLVIGKDQSLFRADLLKPVKDAWLKGMPLLLDNAAAAAGGSYYSAHPPTPKDAEDAELATQKSFFKGNTEIKAGLGLIKVMLEPQVISDNRWGRLFSLAYQHPEQPVFALNQGGGIVISQQSALVTGGAEVLALDLRTARLTLGANQAFVIANGLLDVFAPGENVEPAAADMKAVLERAATPVISPPAASEPAVFTPTSVPEQTKTPTFIPSLSTTPTLRSTATLVPDAAPTRITNPTPTPSSKKVNPATEGFVIWLWAAASLAGVSILWRFFSAWRKRKIGEG